MLRNRILTALVLAPLALAGVLYLPAHWFALVFWAVAALGSYEWAGLLHLEKSWQRVAYVAVFGLLAIFLYGQPGLYEPILIAGCVLWCGAIVAVLVFPRGEALFRSVAFMALLGLLVVVCAWVALIVIRAQPQGGYWLIWLLVLVWGADIGAYFAGRAFGDRKLAPAVSPGKTWAGAIGGFLSAALLCSVGLVWLDAPWLGWWVVMVGLIVVSVFGDLFESVLKRSTGVKDSGTLLPGHGGVLDRIDSLLAVLPVFGLVVSMILGAT